MNDNKYLDATLRERIYSDCEKGFWPDVRFQRNAHGFSLSLWEYGDVMNAYRRCMHYELLKAGYPQGIYTVKRSKAWCAEIDDLLAKLQPITGAQILVNARLRLTPFRAISDQQRWARCVSALYDDAIIDVEIEERDGYFPDTGSAYIWEVVIAETATGWCPVYLTPDQREYKKLVEKEMGR